MMVKCKSYPVIKRKVCCDIILIDVNLSVLNVLGMHEFDLIDHIQFLEEHGTNQSVKITSSYQTLLLYSLFSFYFFHDNSSTYLLSTYQFTARSSFKSHYEQSRKCITHQTPYIHFYILKKLSLFVNCNQSSCRHRKPPANAPYRILYRICICILYSIHIQYALLIVLLHLCKPLLSNLHK